ncbi:MAG: hypothetical protein HYW90_02325 [Candidatus Sungbacteria bacterium]|nr:hypothetical protein [Candidatus Sungbacteria bacterium]
MPEAATQTIEDAPEAKQVEEGEQQGEKNADAKSDSKISTAQAGLMIGVALLFDGAQFVIGALAGLTVFLLPLGIAVGWVVDIWAWLTFFLWLHSLGLSMIKKGGASGGGLGKEPFVIIALAFGIEFIPIINALPAWTAAIATLIFRQRTEAILRTAGGIEKALEPTSKLKLKSLSSKTDSENE